MPPMMPDYQQKARKRFKLGLLAQSQVGHGSVPPHLVNQSGNARQGQSYTVETDPRTGHQVHVYQDGTRVGIADNSPYAPGRRAGFGGDSNTGQLAPPPPKPADLAGQQHEQELVALAKAQQQLQRGVPTPLGSGPGPSRPVEGVKTGHAYVNPGIGRNRQALLQKVLAQFANRNKRRRATGGMLAP